MVSTSRKLAAPTMAMLLMAVVCSAFTPAALAASPTPTMAPTASPTPTMAPTASPGCGNTSVKSGTTDDTMSVAGLDRSWYVHVPSAHDGRTPLPLVVQLHGYGNAVTDMAVTGLDALGDREGFVVATPVGRDAKSRWLFELDTPALDVTLTNPDIAFIASLIERLGRDLCLDTSRIYAAGMSNGAWLTSALPCALGDRIAAIAPVAGVVDFGAACHPARPVPVIAFHGSADTILPVEGGFDPELLAELSLDTGGSFPGDDPVWAVPIRERMAGLAVRDGCQPEPASDPVSADAERFTWTCPPDADMQLIVVDGGGHDWPRSEPGTPDAPDAPGASPRMVDATRLIWDFFSEHPLPAG